MLAFIPLISLLALFITWRITHPDQGSRESALASAVIWATLIALSTEGLGLVHAIDRGSLALFWLIVLAVLLVLIFRGRRGISLRFARPRGGDALVWAMAGVLTLYLGVTLVVALLAPPNTNDAMQYHMSRVMHWIVDRSVAFYPTASDRQLWMPPLAEYAILHFQLLAGGDRFANLVQWLSMAGSVAGVSLIAARLGARRRGQLFAALFAATLPMGVLQSTGAQTDYVTAFWGVCLAFYVLRESERVASGASFRFSADSALLALAFGLGVLSKGTFAACALPLLLWLLIALVRRRSWKAMAGWLGLGLSALLLLNAPLWARNAQTFGNPLGPAVGELGSTVFTPAAVFSTALRNAAMQMAFEAGPANKALYGVTAKIHAVLGIDLNDPRTTLGVYRIRHSVHEDFAGNNWHFILSSLALGFVFVLFGLRLARGRTGGPEGPSSNLPLYYALTVFASYLLFSALFKWQDTDSRLLLPWFLLAAPLPGWVFDRLHRILQFGLVILLALSSLTVLLSNPSRPLIARGGNESLLTATRMRTRFNNSPEIMDDYISVAVTARDLGCRSFGLELDSSTPEYLIWAVLSPSGEDLARVENLLALPQTARYQTPGFRPCAVICNICGVTQSLGYVPIYDRGSLKLYGPPSP